MGCTTTLESNAIPLAPIEGLNASLPTIYHLDTPEMIKYKKLGQVSKQTLASLIMILTLSHLWYNKLNITAWICCCRKQLDTFVLAYSIQTKKPRNIWIWIFLNYISVHHKNLFVWNFAQLFAFYSINFTWRLEFILSLLRIMTNICIP